MHGSRQRKADGTMDRRAFVRCAVGAAAAAAVFGRPGRAAAQGQWWSSLVFALFENHGFDQVAGLPSHQRLAQEGTVLAQYFAVSHPSGPNYRAMVSVGTWGNSETVDTFHPSVGSEAAALDLPIPTYVYHLVGEIPQKHNPFVDLQAPIAGVGYGLDAFQERPCGRAAFPRARLCRVGRQQQHARR